MPTEPGVGRDLSRRLTTLDTALITIGAVVGTGIFLTPGDVVADVPHAGLVLLVRWRVQPIELGSAIPGSVTATGRELSRTRLRERAATPRPAHP